MNSFIFNDAITFKLATQRDDTAAKWQVFFGVLLGVILRWVYTVAVEVARTGGPWNFGTWTTILARFIASLIVSFFVFSGYWEKAKDQPGDMRFINAVAYGMTFDALIAPWVV
ncbi:MAG: hypothetical protein IT314_15990 [Anaerolineales bacterium]|nr:hypothetical protein [Anaerolineales bacterium]